MAGANNPPEMPSVPAMPKPPDSRIIPLDRQEPLTHAQVEQVRFGLGDTGPLAQAVMNANVPALAKQLTIGAVSCLSTRRPADPVVGQMIWEVDTQSVFFWNGTYWATPVNTSPPGVVQAYTGINAPSGWLLCYGQDVSRSTYAALFAAINTTFVSAVLNSTTTVSGLSGMSTATHVGWGIAGNGIPTGAVINSVTNATTVVISAAATLTTTTSVVISPYKFTGANNTTTFLVPDLRGRALFGKDDMGGTAASRVTSTSGIVGTTLGIVGGDQRLQSHNHGVDVNNVSFGLGNSGVQGSNGVATWGGVNGTSAAGSGNSQNMPPTLITNYIIKT